MFSAIYLEEAIADSQRARDIIERLPNLPVITCRHYGEIFNRNAQNFRVQKQAPALILAEKHGRLVLPAPGGYGFSDAASFYFSHMLNCPYDCRYCFLQGMYRSAHHVLFVNYEDFAKQLRQTIASTAQPSVFYSGYDCDSLALEPVSRFSEFFLPFFAQYPRAVLEIRTKSTQIRPLLETTPLPNCVIAMSFASEQASRRWENKVPSLDKRLDALVKLQQKGWPIAIRFEPVIAETGVLDQYQALFAKVFAVLDAASLHSVSVGEFRMPEDYHRRIARLYPDEALFAHPTRASNGVLALQGESDDLLQQLEDRLMTYIQPRQYYRCAAQAG